MNRPTYLNILMAATFLFSLATGMVSFAIVFYVKQRFDADHTMIGMITSGQTLFYIIGVLAFSLNKNTHPRYFLGFSAMGMAVLLTVYQIFPYWRLTLICGCLYGLFMALFWPRISGWVSWGLEGNNLSKTMSQYNFSWSTGGIIAPAVSGFLTEKNIVLPFISTIFMLLFIGLLLFIFSRIYPEMRKGQAEIRKARVKALEEGEDPADTDPEIGTTQMTPLRFPARLGVISTYVISGMIVFIFPAYMRESLGYREGIIGIFLLFRQIFSTAGFILWGRWKGWHFKPRLILLNQVLTVLTLVLLLVSRTPATLLVFFGMMGFNLSFSYTLGQFYGATGSTNRERSMAIHEGVINLGIIVGTFFGGIISDGKGMSVTLFSFLVVCTALLIAQFILLIYFRKKGLLVFVDMV